MEAVKVPAAKWSEQSPSNLRLGAGEVASGCGLGLGSVISRLALTEGSPSVLPSVVQEF